MFDPTSLSVIVFLSLPMAVFSFGAYIVMFRLFEKSPQLSRSLMRTRTRVRYALVAGVAVTLSSYLVAVVILWEYVSVASLSGVFLRVVMFAGLCTLSIYAGAAVASWAFGPEDSQGG
jgi:archaellum biogenesis protein FlaJ (TadC family)